MKKVILTAALAMAACGGGKAVKSSGDETPDWVGQGTGEVSAEGGKKIQGVGSANGADAKARRQQADAAAKSQMDGVVGSLSQALAKMSDSKKPDDVANLAKTAAAQSAQIRDHWVTGDGNEMSLDVLDLAAFKSALAGADGDDKLKKEAAANADKAFDQVAKK